MRLRQKQAMSSRVVGVAVLTLMTPRLGYAQQKLAQVNQPEERLQASSPDGASRSVAADAAQQLGEDAAGVPLPLTFRPWAEGVTDENQRMARAAFQEGNRLLKESLFAQAIVKYQEALAGWDHPAIHYNHALALSTLDQPLKTREELLQAMKYGAAPLGEDQFQQAERYKILVEKQLTHITIQCDSAGAAVTLNGRALFTAPGQYQGFVLPGEQLVSAAKDGHVSDERIMDLDAGKPVTVRLGVYTEAELTRYERKWPQYGPWIVAGAGAVVTGVGAWFFFQARDEQAQFDERAASLCSETSPTNFGTGSDGSGLGIRGCSEDTPEYASLVELRDDAQVDNVIGVSMLAAGGVALVTGAVLLYVNRAQPYRLEPREMVPGKQALQFSAGATPSAVMVTGRGTF